MITNCKLTIFHKTLDKETRLEKWNKYSYEKAWIFGGKGASINKGYDNANDVEVRIPFIDNRKISIGDIIVKGNVIEEISRQQDLKEYETYNVTMVKINNFGNTPHIHLGGK